jgi:hypothetical protein
MLEVISCNMVIEEEENEVRKVGIAKRRLDFGLLNDKVNRQQKLRSRRSVLMTPRSHVSSFPLLSSQSRVPARPPTPGSTPVLLIQNRLPARAPRTRRGRAGLVPPIRYVVGDGHLVAGFPSANSELSGGIGLSDSPRPLTYELAVIDRPIDRSVCLFASTQHSLHRLLCVPTTSFPSFFLFFSSRLARTRIPSFLPSSYLPNSAYLCESILSRFFLFSCPHQIASSHSAQESL